MDLVLLFMQLLAAQYCPLPAHRRVEAIANRQPPRPSLGGVQQIDHVAMCGSERSLRSYTIFAYASFVIIADLFRFNSANTQCITTLTTGVMFIKQ